MFSFIAHHPWWTIFISVCLIGAWQEVYLWLHPERDAKNHWRYYE